MTIETTALPALNVIGYTAEAHGRDQVGESAAGLFGRLIPAITALGFDPDTPTVAWYEETGSTTQLGAGLPTTEVDDAKLAEHGMQRVELDAVEKAVVRRFTGRLDQLQAAWQQLHQDLTGAGLQLAGPCREVYQAGTMSVPDSWVIDLQQPVS